MAFISGSLAAREETDTTSANADAAESEVSSPEMLAPLSVTAPMYKVRLTALELLKWNIFMELTTGFGWPPVSGDFVVTPERVAQTRRNSVNSVDVFDDQKLHANGSTLACNLKFGFTNAFQARGPDWRKGQGPRALLDGAVVTDVFDGAVHENELPAAALARVEFTQNGGAVAWGEAPDGVLQFFTIPAIGKRVREPPPPDADPNYPPPPKDTVHGAGLLRAEVGEFASRSVEFVHTEPTAVGMLQVLGRAASTNGFVAAQSPKKTSLDESEWNRNYWLETRWRRPLNTQTEMTVTIDTAGESRGLGTPGQRADTSSLFGSFSFAGRGTDFAWNGVTFFRRRKSSKTFSAIDRNSGTETPIINETAGPASALGLSWTGSWTHQVDARTNLGIDLRAIRSETTSQLEFVNGNYVRELIAGADRAAAGVFVIHNRRLARNWRGVAGLRFDSWSETNRHRRVIDRSSGTLESERAEVGLREAEFSPSVGLRWEPRQKWRLRVSAQQSFRPPALAERYRVSGERNWLIEPTTSLKTEHSATAEFALEYIPKQSLAFAARGFVMELHHAPGTRPMRLDERGNVEIGRLPAVIQRRLRTTLDRVRIDGMEFTAHAEVWKTWSWETAVRFENATIFAASHLPSAVGKQVPGRPKATGFSAVHWKTTPKLALTSRVWWLGRDFVDEENAMPLVAAIALDAGVNYLLRNNVTMFVQASNAGDTTIAAMSAPDGARYKTRPRLVSAGIQVAW